jgi:hypothetical protein
MITLPWRVNLAIAASAALAATGLTLAFAVPAAGAQTAGSPHSHAKAATQATGAVQAAGAGQARNGDNGDVKIHNSTTAVTDQRNEPHVCVFYLDAFDFDPGQSVSWAIQSWPPTGSRSVVASGTLALDGKGDGHTADMSLLNGHYKLFWNFAGENGFAKQKVFWVACPAQSPSPSPSPSPTHTPGKHKTTNVPAAPAPKAVSTNLPVTG